MHPDFLSAMRELAQDDCRQKHQTAMLLAEPKLTRFGYVLASAGQETFYRYEELLSERVINDQSHVIYFDEPTRQAVA